MTAPPMMNDVVACRRAQTFRTRPSDLATVTKYRVLALLPDTVRSAGLDRTASGSSGQGKLPRTGNPFGIRPCAADAVRSGSSIEDRFQ